MILIKYKTRSNKYVHFSASRHTFLPTSAKIVQQLIKIWLLVHSLYVPKPYDGDSSLRVVIWGWKHILITGSGYVKKNIKLLSWLYCYPSFFCGSLGLKTRIYVTDPELVSSLHETKAQQNYCPKTWTYHIKIATNAFIKFTQIPQPFLNHPILNCKWSPIPTKNGSSHNQLTHLNPTINSILYVYSLWPRCCS